MRGIIPYVLAFGLLEALAAQDVAHRAEPERRSRLLDSI